MASIKEITDELESNLDYEETGDVGKAKRVVTLAKILELKRPASAGGASATIAYSPEALKRMQSEARRFANSRTGSNDASVRYLSQRRR